MNNNTNTSDFLPKFKENANIENIILKLEENYEKFSQLEGTFKEIVLKNMINKFKIGEYTINDYNAMREFIIKIKRYPNINKKELIELIFIKEKNTLLQNYNNIELSQFLLNIANKIGIYSSNINDIANKIIEEYKEHDFKEIEELINSKEIIEKEQQIFDNNFIYLKQENTIDIYNLIRKQFKQFLKERLLSIYNQYKFKQESNFNSILNRGYENRSIERIKKNAKK